MKRVGVLPVLALAVALALLACGDSGEPKTAPPVPVPAPAPPPEPGATLAPEPTPLPTPEATGGKAPKAVDAAAGAASYTTFCAACHGVGGDGNTPFAQVLQPPPTKHNDGNYMNTLTDDYLFKIIKKGGMAVGKSPNMAPWGGALSDPQIRNVIAYIRTLADPPYTPPTR